MAVKKLSRNTIIIAAVLAVLGVTGAAGAVYWKVSEDKPKSQPAPTFAEQANSPEQEKQDAEAHKDEVVKQQQTENIPPATGQKPVVPVVTNASQNGQEVFASGYVPGVFEEGGTCTYTFTKGSLKVEKTTQGFANVSNTGCANLTLARSEFSQAGEWSLVLSYSSPAAKGSSAAKAIAVQ
jgi:cytoskeletal protein RodZ